MNQGNIIQRICGLNFNQLVSETYGSPERQVRKKVRKKTTSGDPFDLNYILSCFNDWRTGGKNLFRFLFFPFVKQVVSSVNPP